MSDRVVERKGACAEDLMGWKDTDLERRPVDQPSRQDLAELTFVKTFTSVNGRQQGLEEKEKTHDDTKREDVRREFEVHAHQNLGRHLKSSTRYSTVSYSPPI